MMRKLITVYLLNALMLLIPLVCFGQVAKVNVALPLKKNIVDLDEYTGRFRAIEKVDIRARVTGYLQKIMFKDGQIVKKGELLFIIDPRPFQYVLNRNKAQYNLAKKQYERVMKLKKQQHVSEESIDQRLQDMMVAKTQLDEAQLDMEFTRVKSPINGQISRNFISVGNLVTRNETILTRVVSRNPIYFYFEISQHNLLKYVRLSNQGKRKRSNDSPTPIYIKLQDENGYPHKGYVNFVDNVIDRGTGTILARATISNDKNIISPGLFGRARMEGSHSYEAILIPEKAINSDQSKKFVYVVDAKNMVSRAYVELGKLRETGFYLVKKGLKGDERIIINGIQLIRKPKQKVEPTLIKLQEESQ